MSDDKEKWEKFVQKLWDDTKSGDIKWKEVSNPLNFKRENANEGLYLAEILEKKVLVYPYDYREWDSSGDSETYEEVAIEFVDRNGMKLWRLPDVDPRFGLLEAVQRQVSEADDFLKRYLNLPPFPKNPS